VSFSDVQPSAWDSDLDTVGEILFGLMMRNVASAGLVFIDPHAPKNRSQPGCIIASPSYWTDLADTTKQDYVYYWKRDGAIAAMEIAAPGVPMDPAQVKTHLTDYVNFAKLCQDAAPGDQAKFTIDGQPFEGWPLQSDGAALQTLALMRAFALLDAPAQTTARAIADQNTNFLLGAYKKQTTSLWEEVTGNSFFARAVQLKCFTELKAQTLGMNAPAQLDDAIDWLTGQLAGHWDGNQYLTFNPPAHKASPGDYDPNMDIVSASIYGAIECTDPKLLATATKIRNQWTEDPDHGYPVNKSDHDLLSLGPLLGRYPGDYYDGVSNSTGPGHPWALCTCNFAQLYYELAKAIEGGTAIPADPIAQPFLSQVQVTTTTPPDDAAANLRGAGDQMLRALIYHSDNLELSEQFDRDSGFEKSVSNLTWSYAALLSALRAR
jgi:glucoamylase